ncbi:hypothetical protein A7T38_05380 [Salmonella enterica subsp. enterica serovar Bareilly]|nr:hypothetical protein [Salmonella enterica]OHG59915.1 hypothetical protein A7S81_05375 [Salmonella enterica subsp. enterica serovar Bareilly]OHK77210.1 hypothetical protein A7S82_05380 [Salmonella enterica subsp. enterica serovar Bareilly]OHK89637.1 hypothetical protein A7S85_04955 [Salmonella enterica subsp. enterica serovar Bareilly]OHM37275.1 hypothetical protein A7T23_07585 [Salmonella enterica subsp. enterica serovar Bareilly]
MKNLSVRSQNLMMILFLLLINIPALMSIGATDKEWIILISSFVFSMDMIVIPLLFIFLLFILVIVWKNFDFLMNVGILSIALLTLSLKDVVVSLLHTSFHS